ncbi:MAG: hypothetical protein OWT27_00635 [Firmicutes bacterium]|nr:hypothetical protein [Bacillota bacterium]
MRTLTAAALCKARNYINAHGRKLEAALWSHEFDGGPLADVLDALAEYQNDDGGFGRGLYPDFTCSESSAIATAVALSHLSRLRVSPSHPLAQSAIGWLLAACDPVVHAWEPVPAAVERAPHALWWTYRPPAPELHKWPDPNAEILGYLLEFSTSAPTASVETLLRLARAALELMPAGHAWEPGDLRCFVRLAERLPEDGRAPFIAAIDAAVPVTVVQQSGRWRHGGVHPLEIAPAPDFRYAGVLCDAIDVQLDYLVRTQGANGSWIGSARAWGHTGRYLAESAQAQAHWRSIATHSAVRMLTAYGRVEAQ